MPGNKMNSFLMKLICFGALAILPAGASSHAQPGPNADPDSLAWLHYKKQFGKLYPNQEEDSMRFANFLDSKRRIERHNANVSATYKMGLNLMSDWTASELSRLSGGSNRPAMNQRDAERLVPRLEWGECVERFPNVPVPDHLDWRKVPGRVTGVKYYAECKADWAIATTGLLEGQLLKVLGRPAVQLSEQQLIDCSKSNNGCAGGNVPDALYDIREMGGLFSLVNYEFIDNESACRLDSVEAEFCATSMGPLMLPARSEELMKAVLASYGPIAVTLDATHLVSYMSGVIKDHPCNKSPNLAALIVGYGVDQDVGRYWLVKNSWTNTWGEDGYFRIERGVNRCGIAENPTIAEL